MRIPLTLLRALLLRGIVLWFLAGLMALVVIAWAASTKGAALYLDSSDLYAQLPGWALVLTPIALAIDIHRRKELMLLRNLGVTQSQVILLGSLPAMTFEAVFLAFRA